MRVFILLLFPIFVFSQNDKDLKYKINLGLNLQPSAYFYKDYLSNGHNPGGYQADFSRFGVLLELETTIQNKYILSGIGLGIGFNPIDDRDYFKPQGKIAFNCKYKDESLTTFLGPVINVGFLFSSPSALDANSFIYRISTSFGLFYAKKYFQLEIGTLFRKKYDNIYIAEFKSCFYMSIGFRIPIKRELKN